jgi:site-specific DNA-adenine methylase
LTKYLLTKIDSWLLNLDFTNTWIYGFKNLFNKLRVEENFFNLRMGNYKKIPASIIFNKERLKSFSQKLGEDRITTLGFSIVLEIQSMVTMQTLK